ncbi:hypothetical protein GCM10011344_03350 [Dokdonia pacifica]|nr:hypothetical protein GCM10011344_03350 [Dokdonia pacifica]
MQTHELLSGSILHFSPPRTLYRSFKKRTDIHYIATDFEDEFIADHSYDITDIKLPDNSQDVIICYHVLEHITEDLKAMNELYRILKPNGVCLIQTPFKEGDIYEDYSITSEAGRLNAFGQKDHVRIYSLNGLNERLQSVNFNTEIIAFQAIENHQNGWLPEHVIKATK